MIAKIVVPVDFSDVSCRAARDLVVMGSHGITRRIPLGSKAEHVLRNVDVPVLLIRGREK